MQYKIDEFVLDTQTRTLGTPNKSKNIRPKTLTLLLFLAERHGEIISKQMLLDSVWDDVKVDDGVIFQSVREIRQLFDNPQILLNHPRKGYEFTAELHPLEEEVAISSKLPEVDPASPNKPPLAFALMSLVVIIAIAAVWQPAPAPETTIEPNTTIEPEQNVTVTQRILVLPIANHITYGDHSWLYFGGMEQLINRLDGLPQSTLVFSADYVPHLMSMAGISRGTKGRDTDNIDIRKLIRLSGATMVVQIQARGNTADYKLLYRFHKPMAIKQGVVVSDNFEDAFEELAQKLAKELEQPLRDSHYQPQKEFSDALFAQAMLSYETDWETSISFFESYLSLNPTSTIAAIYLSKLYLWQKQPKKAKHTIDSVANNAANTRSQQAQVNLVLGRIAAQQQDWENAEQGFQWAMQSTRPYNDWILKANIAEERGLAFISQKQYDKAIEALLKALEFYHITQSPIGINATSLHLASAYFQHGEPEEGTRLYNAARHNILSQRIHFLDSMLADYTKRYASQQAL